MDMRIGQGIDFHVLKPNVPLFLGGVKIVDAPKGAVGHSDADVLMHAICDAMLGALALGDIGTHFPNTDESYKNIDSKILLQKVYQIISNLQYEVVNVDSTICLEEPKINAYRTEMQAAIAQILQVQPTQISIKATTTEGLGSIGRAEGICALANVLLTKK